MVPKQNALLKSITNGKFRKITHTFVTSLIPPVIPGDWIPKTWQTFDRFWPSLSVRPLHLSHARVGCHPYLPTRGWNEKYMSLHQHFVRKVYVYIYIYIIKETTKKITTSAIWIWVCQRVWKYIKNMKRTQSNVYLTWHPAGPPNDTLWFTLLKLHLMPVLLALDH